MTQLRYPKTDFWWTEFAQNFVRIIKTLGYKYYTVKHSYGYLIEFRVTDLLKEHNDKEPDPKKHIHRCAVCGKIRPVAFIASTVGVSDWYCMPCRKRLVIKGAGHTSHNRVYKRKRRKIQFT